VLVVTVFVTVHAWHKGLHALTLPARAANPSRTQAVHEHGGYGSAGYGYCWKRSEAQKNLLRTHTTAVSSRMLYKLAQEGFK
jgi:phenylalanyl-tRNA synthetase alpha subunit